jgi:hypothetical protein
MMESGRLADGDGVVEEGALGGPDDALAAAVFASWWERDDGWPWRIKLDYLRRTRRAKIWATRRQLVKLWYRYLTRPGCG